jgi:hypothetical protein
MLLRGKCFRKSFSPADHLDTFANGSALSQKNTKMGLAALNGPNSYDAPLSLRRQTRLVSRLQLQRLFTELLCDKSLSHIKLHSDRKMYSIPATLFLVQTLGEG